MARERHDCVVTAVAASDAAEPKSRHQQSQTVGADRRAHALARCRIAARLATESVHRPKVCAAAMVVNEPDIP